MIRISTDELFDIEGIDFNIGGPGRKFCIQHYKYDNECTILEVQGLMCLIEYTNWENVGGTKLKTWVTVDMIRTK